MKKKHEHFERKKTESKNLNWLQKCLLRKFQFEGVAGIIFIGGLARGFADKYSNLDIIVFLDCKDEVGTIAEMWVDRGDLLSAHYCLNYSVDLVVGILYALNKEFMPTQKWRIFHSYRLKWLPTDYKKLMQEAATVKNLSERNLNRRIKVLRKLEIAPKIEKETG